MVRAYWRATAVCFRYPRTFGEVIAQSYLTQRKAGPIDSRMVPRRQETTLLHREHDTH